MSKKKFATAAFVMLAVPLTGCGILTASNGLDYGGTPPTAHPDAMPCLGQTVSLGSRKEQGCFLGGGMAVGTKVILKGVNFDTAKATLTPDSRATLDEVVASLTANPSVMVEIGGHTDSRSSDAYNQKLSEARARSVVGYLVAHGIAADRLSAAGYGESLPIADNGTAEGRLENRRVELKVVAGGAVTTKAGLREIKYVDLEPDDSTVSNSFRKLP